MRNNLNNLETSKLPGKPNVIVIGLDHIIGLQTARIFTQRRVPVIGVAKNPKHFCCRTKVCEKILFTEPDACDLIELLISLGRELEQKSVLVTCRDMYVLLISRHRQALEPFYHIALPEAAVVEMLMDKESFYKFALDENLPIPKYFMIKNKIEAEIAAEKLRFPCILKPPLKTPSWVKQTDCKAYKVHNKAEFFKTYEQCSDWTEILMGQEWIPGDDTYLYSCNSYFNSDSQPLVTFTAAKLRQWPPETGSTSLGVECKNDVVLSESTRLFKKVAFKGLAYLEMKRDVRNGEYYIIEPNIGRPTGRSALAEACGVELLYTMYCDSIGFPLSDETKQKFVGVKWIHLRADLMSALKYWRRGDLRMGDWWRSLRGPKFYAVLAWKDPLPFLAELRFGIIFLIKKLTKKLALKKPASVESTLHKSVHEVNVAQ